MEEAFLEVGRTVEVDGHRIEILRTLADCIGTKLFFRSDAPFGSWVTPHAVWPPELLGSMSCHGGDIMEAEFEPVSPDREEIKVVFGRMGEDRSTGAPVTIPVDRRRTARFERRLAGPQPAPAEADGVTIAVTAARVGVLSGRIDLDITCRDDSIIACEIGWPHSIHTPPGGPGPPALWNDWHPGAAVPPRMTRTHDGKVQVSMSRSVSVTATARPKRSRPAPPERPRPPEPPNPAAVLEVPGGVHLEQVSAHKHRENREPRLESSVVVTHAPPSPEGRAVELIVSGLYLFRFASGRIVTVPFPTSDVELDLSGTTFETDHGPVEIIKWEPAMNEIPTLVVRTPSPWWWPDIRVLHGNQSASFWMHPGHDGTLNAVLPAMYKAAFTDPAGVRLGLRLLGRPAPEARIAIPLSAPGR